MKFGHRAPTKELQDRIKETGTINISLVAERKQLNGNR